MSRLRAFVTQLTPGRVLLLALGLRLLWLLLCPNEPYSDQAIYHETAKALAEGKGYVDQPDIPANLYPVGYAAAIAPFYWLFGPHYTVAYLLNVVAGVAMVAGGYQLGKLLWGESAGRLSALFLAVHPTFVLLPTIIATENVFCAGVPWLVWLLVRTVREADLRRSLGLAAASGALVALMVYVRPSGLALLACPVLFGLSERTPRTRIAATTVVAAACALLVLLPWGLRNKAEYGRFSVTSFNGGANLWMGNNPESDGSYMLMPKDTIGMGEVERDDVLRQRATAFIKEHPGAYVRLTLNRLQMTLRSDTIAPTWNKIGIEKRFGARAIPALKVPCTLAHWALLVGLAVVLLRARRSRTLGREDLHLAWTFAVLAFPFVFIVGGNRYMLPTIPVLCVWAASAARAARTATEAAPQAKAAPAAEVSGA
jgi:4-amino-4-deoxy-L-arabinose transferase-like glycosyltransferase